MAKYIRGTIPDHGNITITFAGENTVIPVTRESDGTYNEQLPSALNIAMAAGGTCSVSYGEISIPVSFLADTGNSPLAGVVGQEPPSYSGGATLPSIPSPNGLRFEGYPNQQAQFFWNAIWPFSAQDGDRYELVVDGIIVFRNTAHDHFIEPFQNGTHSASIRVVRDDGQYGEATELIDFEYVSQPAN